VGITDHLSDECIEYLKASKSLAAKLGSSYLEAHHVFWFLLQQEPIRSSLVTQWSVRSSDLEVPPEFQIAEGNQQPVGSMTVAPSLAEAAEWSRRRKNETGRPVGPAEFCAGLLLQNSVRQTLPADRYDRLRNCLCPVAQIEVRPRQLPSSVTRFGRVLTTQEAVSGLPQLIGRDAVMIDTMAGLIQRNQRSVMLLGPAGVGKTAIALELARRILEDRVPSQLRGCHVVELTANRFISGTKYRGQLEEQVESFLKAASARTDLVLFMDEFHAFAGLGRDSESGYSVMDALKPAIADGRLRIISSTTEAEYARYVQADGALRRRFVIVRVPEPATEAVRAILAAHAALLEEHHHISIPSCLLDDVLALAGQYAADTSDPARSIALLSRSAALRQLKAEGVLPGMEEGQSPSERDACLTLSDLHAVLSAEIAAPIGRDVGEEATALIESLSRVIGQDAATAEVRRQVLQARSTLRDSTKPRCALLLAGPSGVGKTYCAEMLARGLFGSTSRLVRLDMSEYSQEELAISKLLGSTPGYVGYGEGGTLTRPLRQTPHCVLLLDEFEKAHPEVWNLFLQALEEGSVTDGRGFVASLRHCYVIATTNAGERDRRTPMGFLSSDEGEPRPVTGHEVAEAMLAAGFPRELLGRFSAIIRFERLGLDAIERIVEQRLEEFAEKLEAVGRNLRYDASSLVHRIARMADGRLGARSAASVIDRLLSQEVGAAEQCQPRAWANVTAIRLIYYPSYAQSGGRAPVPLLVLDPAGAVADSLPCLWPDAQIERCTEPAVADMLAVDTSLGFNDVLVLPRPDEPVEEVVKVVDRLLDGAPRVSLGLIVPPGADSAAIEAGLMTLSERERGRVKIHSADAPADVIRQTAEAAIERARAARLDGIGPGAVRRWHDLEKHELVIALG
jgi:ATP-dependent Clp protease ATP-binding subunit ClpA